jgi:hypothetical protein
MYPQRLAMSQSLVVISQIGQALTYLHTHNLIHGQIKPEHILFDAKGQALLSEPYCFTSPAPWDVSNENASNAFRYLAPEQFANRSSAFSDQYALCCVAYELLTGRPPFILRDPQGLSEQQQYSEPAPLSQFVADISETIEQAILKGLAKDPAQRHADVAALLAAFQPAPALIAIPDLPLSRSKPRTVSLAPTQPILPPLPVNNQPSAIQILQPVVTPSSTNQPSATSSSTNAFIDQSELIAQASMPEDLQKLIDIFDIDTNFEHLPSKNSPELKDSLPAIAIEDHSDHTLEGLLPDMAREEELLLATNEQISPSAAVELDAVDSSLSATASTPLAEDTVDMPAVADIPTMALFIPVIATSLAEQTTQASMRSDAQWSASPNQHELALLAATTQLAQFSPQQPRTSQDNSLKPSQYSVRLGSSKPNRRPSSKRQTMIALGFLVFLLMIGSLVTYIELTSTKSTSSSLTLLSTTPSPTPRATIDQLGTLPKHTTPTAQNVVSTDKNQPTSKPTVKPTVKPTATPMPVIIPTVPPTATSVPVSQPTAPADVSVSYEAESSMNTRGADLREFSCSLCSGGERIGWIANNDTLRFNDIVVNHSRNYTLQIYYYNSVPNRVTQLYASVNGGDNTEVTGLQVSTVTCCNYAPYVVNLTITLNAGKNAITLSNPNGEAPDVDRIVVVP